MVFCGICIFDRGEYIPMRLMGNPEKPKYMVYICPHCDEERHADGLKTRHHVGPGGKDQATTIRHCVVA